MITKSIDFIKKFNWSFRSVAKVAIFIIAGVALLAVALAVLGAIFRFAFMGMGPQHKMGMAQDYTLPTHMMGGIIDGAEEIFGGVFPGRGFHGVDVMQKRSAMTISASIPEPHFDGAVRAEMEDYERVSYNANIERYKIEPLCNSIEALKPLSYVVFKNASRTEKNCSYRFSVESEREEEIAGLVQGMTPDSFNVNIDTIEPAVSGNVFESAVLQERLESINNSLTQAKDAYDKAITLATKSGRVESLSSLINGKLSLVERLGNQKRNVATQLARLVRSGESAISETEYVHFYVNINKKQIVDWGGIGSTWRYKVDEFVGSVSNILQKLTFGSLLFILIVLKFLVYLFVLIAFARLAWTLARKIWKWEMPKVIKIIKK